MMLVREPALVFRDHGRAVAVPANPERIAPLAASPDIDGARRRACVMTCLEPCTSLARPDPVAMIAGRTRFRRAGHPSLRRGNGLPVDLGVAASNPGTAQPGSGLEPSCTVSEGSTLASRALSNDGRGRAAVMCKLDVWDGEDRRAVEADEAATTKPASLRRWSVCSALVRHLGITPSDKLNRRSPLWRPCLFGRTPLRRDGRRIRSLCHLFGASPLLGLAAITRA
jgi:hypothetical protein